MMTNIAHLLIDLVVVQLAGLHELRDPRQLLVHMQHADKVKACGLTLKQKTTDHKVMHRHDARALSVGEAEVAQGLRGVQRSGVVGIGPLQLRAWSSNASVAAPAAAAT